MTDNELLLAISGMMDKKLKAELQPVKNDLKNVKNDIKQLRNDLENDINQVKDDLENVKSNIKQFKSDLENDINHVKIFQETKILPRLDTITACYSDTYNRYNNNADRMDAAFDDIELLKKVVSGHSRILENIS